MFNESFFLNKQKSIIFVAKKTVLQLSVLKLKLCSTPKFCSKTKKIIINFEYGTIICPFDVSQKNCLKQNLFSKKVLFGLISVLKLDET